MRQADDCEDDEAAWEIFGDCENDKAACGIFADCEDDEATNCVIADVDEDEDEKREADMELEAVTISIFWFCDEFKIANSLLYRFKWLSFEYL